MEIKINYWINKNNKSFFGKGRIKLLKLIDKYGSISKAAKEMKMSYKAAWDAIDIINSIAKKPAVEKQSGGKGGGGTYLTDYGKELIKNFENLEKEINEFKKNLNNKYSDKF
jgi:molybdate transport system regulatory protein